MAHESDRLEKILDIVGLDFIEDVIDFYGELEPDKRKYFNKMLGYTPRVLFEIGLIGTTILSAGAATVGTIGACLYGDAELAKNMVTAGGIGTLMGATATYSYAFMTAFFHTVGPIGEQDITEGAIALDEVIDNYQKLVNK